MDTLFLRFLDHTQRHTTVGRISLNEWSACCRDLATHNTHNRQASMHRRDSNPRSQQAIGLRFYWQDNDWVMNWKRWTKVSLSVWRHSGVCVDGLRKTYEKPDRIAGLRFTIWICHPFPLANKSINKMRTSGTTCIMETGCSLHVSTSVDTIFIDYYIDIILRVQQARLTWMVCESALSISRITKVTRQTYNQGKVPLFVLGTTESVSKQKNELIFNLDSTHER